MMAVAVALACVATPRGQQAPKQSGVRYMRDSEEYAALARQIYRIATDAVTRAAQAAGRHGWAVVLDIDETALDNSAYELERAAYNQPFDAASFSAWVRRRESGAVPGAGGFVAAVRRAGGRIAWISNRDASAADATRDNLRAAALWNDDDRLCLQEGPQRPKRVRRGEVIAGRGGCAWSTPVSVLAFIGDQMSDFPAADEGVPGTGTDEAFGRTCFLLPNSMYGDWMSRVTRVR